MNLWVHISDAIIKSTIAIITLAAAVLLIVAWALAWRERRRPQLVVPDMDESILGPTAVAGLSSQVRHLVRQAVNSPGAPAAASLVTTVGKDIAGGIVDLRSRVRDIPRLQLDLTAPRREIQMFAAVTGAVSQSRADELLSSLSTTLPEALAGGISVSPGRTGGWLGVLSATLPRQRGSVVNLVPQMRESSGLRQVGLTLEAGPIDRSDQASATFWSTGTPSDTTGNTHNDRDQLAELLRPAAIWIAIYLIASGQPVRRTKRVSFAWTFHRKELSDEVDALRAILAAQLATYEMFWYSAKPLIALGFFDQALADVDHAMRVLDSYFRPHYIAGTIHELRGDALIALKDLLSSADDAADTAFAGSYGRQAPHSFDEAHKEFDRALTLLNHPTGTAAGHADELRHDCHVRSLKAALRGSDPPRALNQVLSKEVAWDTLEQRYNIACLYAVASAVADDLGRGGQELAMQSRSHLVAAIKEEPTFANIIRSDPDLLSAFMPEELRRIAQDATQLGLPRLDEQG